MLNYTVTLGIRFVLDNLELTEGLIWILVLLSRGLKSRGLIILDKVAIYREVVISKVEYWILFNGT